MVPQLAKETREAAERGEMAKEKSNSGYAWHKFNDETLKAAVSEWRKGRTATEKKYGDLSKWDTSKVTDMHRMFDGASKMSHFHKPPGAACCSIM